MTKMADTPVCGKTPLRNFSVPKEPVTLGLGRQHRGIGPNPNYTIANNTLTILKHNFKNKNLFERRQSRLQSTSVQFLVNSINA